jgi:hypothetical protein
MLSRGFRTSKKQKIWAAALNTQKYICMRVSGLMESSFHTSLITVCRVVPVLPFHLMSVLMERKIPICLLCASANLYISARIMTDFRILINQL